MIGCISIELELSWSRTALPRMGVGQSPSALLRVGVGPLPGNIDLTIRGLQLSGTPIFLCEFFHEIYGIADIFE
ncbi:hypothetical protein [Bacillus massilinigeriensis]|uniref:hypothetical protein n=1 Tax=Bacillus massilionigeriensis TaxID=1805475 RepID=UPI00096B6322|nr:hypothetical protein [Bacillus massilionigeriensis]